MEPSLALAGSSDEEDHARSRLLPPLGLSQPSRSRLEHPAPRRSAAVGHVGRLAPLLGLGIAAAAALTALGRLGLREARSVPPRSPLLQLDAAGGESEDHCERCPVGSCVRGARGGCRLWDDHGGGYYCQVEHCSQVLDSGPHSHFQFSECWAYRGHFFFAVQDTYAHCQDSTTHSPASRTTPPKSTTTVRETTTTEAPTTTATRTSTTQATTTATTVESTTSTTHQAATTTTTTVAETTVIPTDKEPKRKERVEAGSSESERDATSRARPTGLGSFFDHLASSVAEEAIIHDPRLSAYWDLADCGPVGDDHNIKWCGGHADEPECAPEVEVNVSLCLSERATLAFVRHEEGGTVQLGGCTFIYYAQYECVATTTTTTTVTTSTTSTTTTSTTTTTTTTSSTITTTVTTSTTSTTTSTTTTSKTTTTGVEEGDMIDGLKELESQITGPDGGWSLAAGFGYSCSSRFQPPAAPLWATDLNGVRLPDVCFKTPGPHYVQVIADWGGMLGTEGPYPACQRPKASFVKGVDDSAQQRVASQMARRAQMRSPDYLLNGGDNFYWGGIDTPCGASARTIKPTGQLEWNFEKIYTGPGLEERPWLGVLGNHDYGGFRFDRGWDQLISYTWGPSGRWVMPAQYWSVAVRYPGFVVDYYFLDTNYFNAKDPGADPEHNICSGEHTPKEASCGPEGPANVSGCNPWFTELWEKQQVWLKDHLAKTSSDWQIVVTHFPPYYGREFWEEVSHRYGIDMIITGHVHKQELHGDDKGNFLRPTTWIVSGGGGGITSEDIPDVEGRDDQYGFFELTMTKNVIEIQGISHGGSIRKTAFARPRPRAEEEAS